MKRHVAGWALAAVTTVALMSIGGAAIVGAPVLLPALWFATTRSHGWARRGFATLAALVLFEVTWAVVYVASADAAVRAAAIP